jgi:hypothetical protein
MFHKSQCYCFRARRFSTTVSLAGSLPFELFLLCTPREGDSRPSLESWGREQASKCIHSPPPSENWSYRVHERKDENCIICKRTLSPVGSVLDNSSIRSCIIPHLLWLRNAR